MSESKTDRSWKNREDGIAYGFTYDPNSHDELNRRLDQALADTFPASDPVSIVISVVRN